MKQTAFEWGEDGRTEACESEAERKFTLGGIPKGWLRQAANDNGIADDGFSYWTNEGFPDIGMVQQQDIYRVTGIRHRADFAFLSCKTPTRGVFVEIDGDRWHIDANRMRKDKRIDRAIQSAPRNWRVLRFPACEVLNTTACARTWEEIHTHLRRHVMG